MICLFDSEIAKEIGLNSAILLQNIFYWCEKNRANGQNFNDGLYWTYNSTKAYAELFPFMSVKAIRNALKKLEDCGYIKVGNYNEKTYDRTSWYAITQKGKCIVQKGQMDCAERANALCQKGEPIPNNYQNKEKDNTYVLSKKKVPPTLEEVTAYCTERHNGINPRGFIDFYTAKGWKIGKEPMKDWKAAIRTWENKRKETETKPESKPSFDIDELERQMDFEIPEI